MDSLHSLIIQTTKDALTNPTSCVETRQTVLTNRETVWTLRKTVQRARKTTRTSTEPDTQLNSVNVHAECLHMQIDNLD